MKKSGSGRALMVLAAAGGLWAWNNRDKVRGFIEQQRDQIKSNTTSHQRVEKDNNAFTGETRRMDDSLTERSSEPELNRRVGSLDPSI